MRASTYLHTEENKALYQDILEKTASSNCLFSRNIPSFLDGEEIENAFFESHVLNCDVCQSKIRFWNEKIKKLDSLIPLVKLEGDRSQSIDIEIDSIVKTIRKKRRSEVILDAKERLKFPMIMLKDLVKSFGSLTFFKWTFFAAFSFIVLYFYRLMFN